MYAQSKGQRLRIAHLIRMCDIRSVAIEHFSEKVLDDAVIIAAVFRLDP